MAIPVADPQLELRWFPDLGFLVQGFLIQCPMPNASTVFMCDSLPLNAATFNAASQAGGRTFTLLHHLLLLLLRCLLTLAFLLLLCSPPPVVVFAMPPNAE